MANAAAESKTGIVMRAQRTDGNPLPEINSSLHIDSSTRYRRCPETSLQTAVTYMYFQPCVQGEIVKEESLIKMSKATQGHPAEFV